MALRHSETIIPARMKAYRNFSDASVEQFHSVSQKKLMMSLSDFDEVDRPCNSLFEFQEIHRFVYIAV